SRSHRLLRPTNSAQRVCSMATTLRRTAALQLRRRLPLELTTRSCRDDNQGGSVVDIKPIIDTLNTGLFIDGQWRSAEGGKTIEVHNPATGETLTTVADGSAHDAERGIRTPGEAQADWAATAPRERAEILRRAFELLTERADDIAAVMTAEMGKPFAESKGEVAYGAEFFRWFSEEAVRFDGEYAQSA